MQCTSTLQYSFTYVKIEYFSTTVTILYQSKYYNRDKSLFFSFSSMSQYCSVPSCSNNKRKSPHLSFHDFPVDKTLRAKWVRAIRRDEGPHFVITRGSTHVCGEHFHPDDLHRSSKTSGRTRIKQGAVPSRFHWNDWGNYHFTMLNLAITVASLSLHLFSKHKMHFQIVIPILSVSRLRRDNSQV